MKRRLAPLLFVTCLLLQLGAADTKPLHFLTATSLDPIALLPDPTPAGSSEQSLELETVLKLQNTRTDAQVARANTTAKMTVFIFADVLGPSFNAKSCPKTDALFQLVDSDSKYFSKLAKAHFARPRPAAFDNRVKPSISGEVDTGYPSGHATRGMLFAELLAEMVPDQRAQLMERGRQIGWDRVIAGVHYPTDVFAGRTLGQALAQALLAQPEFRAQLDAAREELHHIPANSTAALK